MKKKWNEVKRKGKETKKKKGLKEKGGESAAPMSVTEPQPAPAHAAAMSPEQSYDAGYNDAVAEMMEIITQMMTGAVPVDMEVPADIAHMDQLEEEEEEEEE